MAANEELISAARSGDERAFERLVETEAQGAFRLALAILGSATEAEDAAQDAFIRAWRDLPRLREVRSWTPWLRRLIVHAALDRTRRTRQIREVPLGLESARSEDPSRPVEVRDEIEHALRRVSPDDRAILALRYLVGLDVAEVAAALGIPLGTAKSRLHRSLARVRAVSGDPDR
jgi:RNA polymerase sigma factor (sigma-70 family)